MNTAGRNKEHAGKDKLKYTVFKKSKRAKPGKAVTQANVETPQDTHGNTGWGPPGRNTQKQAMAEVVVLEAMAGGLRGHG